MLIAQVGVVQVGVPIHVVQPCPCAINHVGSLSHCPPLWAGLVRGRRGRSRPRSLQMRVRAQNMGAYLCLSLSLLGGVGL